MDQLINRKDYSSSSFEFKLPNLLGIQRRSFEKFLQRDVGMNDKLNEGLQKAFQDNFPIQDTRNKYSLEFESYSLGKPKYTERECLLYGRTYEVPVRATLSLNVFEGEDRRFLEKITNDVYISELPLMTENGSFIINGAERVIVSQLHRSPGVSFDELENPEGGSIYKAKVIPRKGSWIEFILDVNDVMYVSIDRRRKIPTTILIRILGIASNEEILEHFYEKESLKLHEDMFDDFLTEDCVLFNDVINENTGEIIANAGTLLSGMICTKILSSGITKVDVVKDAEANPVIYKTILADNTKDEETALFRVYNLIRPGETTNISTARELFRRLFFDAKRYDLGSLGRYRLNTRLKLDIAEDILTLTEKDILKIISYLVSLKLKEGVLDDIDHLGSRRVRSVGELIQEQFNSGFTRMTRVVREKINLRDTEDITPQDLINSRTVGSVIMSFFGSSQLSQFMDQMNPLSEMTHKRRVSALGPDGLTRERAGFEVRDVHYTHYGRLCPIETPEGPNIGLISSLTSYARINDYGFIETPYWVVKNGKITEELVYLTADKEDDFKVAPASTLMKNGKITASETVVRSKGEFPLVPTSEVNFIDVSPRQLISPAASLVPFLEHNDANRALMGSNMQRQAVPLIQTDSPIVGTGMEQIIAYDSGVLVKAKHPGVISYVDAQKIIIKKDKKRKKETEFYAESEYEEYVLKKFLRSNQDSCINQKPIVTIGQKINEGDVIADGPATSQSELALGKNIRIAFLPWNGYNYEDAIILSEDLAKRDVFTSVHIEEFTVECRDTKLGSEELTRELPNVTESAIGDLDERGLIRVGAHVTAGSILVGKVTPKGETELLPEERLLRAIFGEKSSDVKDTSLRVPPSIKGVVVDVQMLSRQKNDKLTRQQDKKEIQKLKKSYNQKIQYIVDSRDQKLIETLLGTESKELRDSLTDDILLKDKAKYTKAVLESMDWLDVVAEKGFSYDEKKNKIAEIVVNDSNEMIVELEQELDREIDKVVNSNQLKAGVLQLVKVCVAKKRKISVGDKMAGRHGNKGVISKIVPVEDMPFDSEGDPVEILLNPLGVPSRMNIGQLLEVHLGLAAKKQGIKVKTPVFDGATYQDVLKSLDEVGMDAHGKSVLFDGRTGEQLKQKVTVGYMYILKLGHLVEDKFHARSIGPYSLVTQQPLGGKSQFGGQRFGEMEVWALEAYGAAYTLQEILTVKSDDILGRSKIYESIIKGENTSEAGLPESFNVLIKEIQALCLDIKYIDENAE